MNLYKWYQLNPLVYVLRRLVDFDCLLIQGYRLVADFSSNIEELFLHRRLGTPVFSSTEYVDEKEL